MRTSTKYLIPVALLSMVLAACGTTPAPEPEPETTYKASFYALPALDPYPSEFTPLGAAVGVIDPYYLLEDEELEPVGSLGVAALIDLGEFKVGPMTTFAEDGTVELAMPSPDDLADLLVPASELIGYVDPGTCAVEASDPTVMVTPVVFELITLPGPVVYTPAGLALGLLSNVEVEDLDGDDAALDGLSIYGFAYTEAPVSVTGGCEADPDLVLVVDLHLEAGWNLFAWNILMNEGQEGEEPSASLTLTNADAPAEMKLTLLPYF